MRQTWAHLLFLHWRCDPGLLQATLPPGLTIDTHEGDAWIAVVPFFMQKVRPRFCPAVPGLSSFLELNLRTYVRDAGGRPGVWFYSLDCNQSLATWIAQKFFSLPYEHAEMEALIRYGKINYSSRRKGQPQTDTFCYPSGLTGLRTAGQNSLEAFLLERYRLFSAKPDGSLRSGLVHHAPYQFAEIQADFSPSSLFEYAGLPAPQTPPESILAAAPVDVTIHPLQKVPANLSSR